jgi:hypothetical protein
VWRPDLHRHLDPPCAGRTHEAAPPEDAHSLSTWRPRLTACGLPACSRRAPPMPHAGQPRTPPRQAAPCPRTLPSRRSGRPPIKGCTPLPSRVQAPCLSPSPAAPPLPPPCGAHPCAHFFGHLTPRTSPLGPIRARAIACCPAFRRFSPEFHPQRPPPLGAAEPAHRSSPRLHHHFQSPLGEHPGGLMPFVGQVRPAIAAGELTRRREGRFVRIGFFARAYV